MKVDPDHVISMDETPFYLSPSIPCLVNQKKEKSTIAETLKNCQMKVTLILAMASDGSKLPPLLLLMGKPEKTLHKRLRKNPIIQQKFNKPCKFDIANMRIFLA